MPIPSVSSINFCFSKHYAAADRYHGPYIGGLLYRIAGVTGPWVAGVKGPRFMISPCVTLLGSGVCLVGGSTVLWGDGTTVFGGEGATILQGDGAKQ